jgi:hypothetical protein
VPRQSELDAYIREAKALIAQSQILNAAGVKRVREEFSSLLDDILGIMPRSVTLDTIVIANLMYTLADRIDDAIFGYGVIFTETALAQVELSNRFFLAYGKRFMPYGTTIPLAGDVATALEISTQLSLRLVRGTTSQIQALVGRTLSLGALGAARAFDASAAVNAVLGGVKKLAASPEQALRTETLRMQSIATQVGLNELNMITRVNKMWVWSQISRIEHAAISGQVRPVNGLFDVPLREGGYVQMMYPRDVGAPLSAVINCACYVIPLPVGVLSAAVAA